LDDAGRRTHQVSSRGTAHTCVCSRRPSTAGAAGGAKEAFKYRRCSVLTLECVSSSNISGRSVALPFRGAGTCPCPWPWVRPWAWLWLWLWVWVCAAHCGCKASISTSTLKRTTNKDQMGIR
jgi:hypothetical protein